jgi:membrane protein DedA with SNARE-associated domain
MLVLASISDPVVEIAVDVVAELGLLGIFVLMVLESACIPVPSEATMLFAGFNVAEGEYTLFAAVAAGSVANLVGSWIAYALG